MIPDTNTNLADMVEKLKEKDAKLHDANVSYHVIDHMTIKMLSHDIILNLLINMILDRVSYRGVVHNVTD